MLGLELTPGEVGLLVAVVSLFFGQLFYLFWMYVWPWRKRHAVSDAASNDFLPVSLIVYAEDSAEQLRAHLPLFLQQDYPQFEVIVVSDGLSEPCREVLSRLKAEYPTLVYNEHTQLVTGFCAYPYTQGFQDQFIAFDNLKYGLQYLSAGLWKHFYGGTNKNLSYTKELFFQHKGFYNQFYLKSGEDNLFINEAANRENARVSYEPDSILKRDRILRLKEWTDGRIMRQSAQSLYTCRFYRFFKWEDICFGLFLGADIGLFVSGIRGQWQLALLASLLWMLYVGVKGYLFVRISKWLQQKISLWMFPFFDFLHPFYSLYIEMVSRFKKRENYVFVIEK